MPELSSVETLTDCGTGVSMGCKSLQDPLNAVSDAAAPAAAAAEACQEHPCLLTPEGSGQDAGACLSDEPSCATTGGLPALVARLEVASPTAAAEAGVEVSSQAEAPAQGTVKAGAQLLNSIDILMKTDLSLMPQVQAQKPVQLSTLHTMTPGEQQVQVAAALALLQAYLSDSVAQASEQTGAVADAMNGLLAHLPAASSTASSSFMAASDGMAAHSAASSPTASPAVSGAQAGTRPVPISPPGRAGAAPLARAISSSPVQPCPLQPPRRQTTWPPPGAPAHLRPCMRLSAVPETHAQSGAPRVPSPTAVAPATAALLAATSAMLAPQQMVPPPPPPPRRAVDTAVRPAAVVPPPPPPPPRPPQVPPPPSVQRTLSGGASAALAVDAMALGLPASTAGLALQGGVTYQLVTSMADVGQQQLLGNYITLMQGPAAAAAAAVGGHDASAMSALPFTTSGMDPSVCSTGSMGPRSSIEWSRSVSSTMRTDSGMSVGGSSIGSMYHAELGNVLGARGPSLTMQQVVELQREGLLPQPPPPPKPSQARLAQQAQAQAMQQQQVAQQQQAAQQQQLYGLLQQQHAQQQQQQVLLQQAEQQGQLLQLSGLDGETVQVLGIATHQQPQQVLAQAPMQVLQQYQQQQYQQQLAAAQQQLQQLSVASDLQWVQATGQMGASAALMGGQQQLQQLPAQVVQMAPRTLDEAYALVMSRNNNTAGALMVPQLATMARQDTLAAMQQAMPAHVVETEPLPVLLTPATMAAEAVMLKLPSM